MSTHDDLAYHFPSDLFNLLVDTIPLLNPSKRDVITFFRGAGVPSDILDPLTVRLREDRNSVNKYEMVRVVLDRLNSRQEATIRPRREVVKRVVEFNNFDACWPADQLSARGLVASIREVVGQKDAFTRMANERDQERRARLAQAEAIAKERRERAARIEAAKNEFYGLFAPHLTPQARGKKLETALNNVFAAYGILVRQAFHLVGQEGEGVVEQVDGVIALQGDLYYVEMKWYAAPVGTAEISHHLVRLMGRARRAGYSYRPAAIQHRL
ncbi:restriction endonuclease [Reyranella sp.]|uniref:restriction endonuclease n=1 Tax=Reyranella sp. TaxID=1929291 RepID=UPI003783A9A6